jgi:hypothetical protein
MGEDRTLTLALSQRERGHEIYGHAGILSSSLSPWEWVGVRVRRPVPL